MIQLTPSTLPSRQGDDAMVEITVRLPRRVAARLADLCDEWNMPVQSVVLMALQIELGRRDPVD